MERKISQFTHRPWGGRKARCRGHKRIMTDILARAAPSISPDWPLWAHTTKPRARLSPDTTTDHPPNGSIFRCRQGPEFGHRRRRPTRAHYISGVLGPLDALPAEEHTVLLDTFQAWLQAGGSANHTAAMIYCHPNTVRHRLHRIEELTGRSLSRPRDLAELCLAFEVERRLP